MMRATEYLAALALASAPLGMPASNDGLTPITVHVDVDGNAPEGVVAGAMHFAKVILKSGGFAVTWVNCKKTPCRRTWDPELFILRIADEVFPSASRSALGFAIPKTLRANYAVIMYPRVIDFVNSTGVRNDETSVLAAAMSHELGHLLFRSCDHSDGIMKAKWSLSDLKLIRQGRLKFNLNQQEALQAAMTERIASLREIALLQ